MPKNRKIKPRKLVYGNVYRIRVVLQAANLNTNANSRFLSSIRKTKMVEAKSISFIKELYQLAKEKLLSTHPFKTFPSFSNLKSKKILYNSEHKPLLQQLMN